MNQPQHPSDLETLLNVIKLYDAPEAFGEPAMEKLLLMADTARILKENRVRSVSTAMESVGEHIDGIIAGLRPVIEAAMGPSIGSLAPAALQAIDLTIATHLRRMEMIEQSTDHAATYDALIADGWKTHLPRDAWAADDYEQKLAKQAESFFISQREHERKKIEAAFERFVTKCGSFGR